VSTRSASKPWPRSARVPSDRFWPVPVSPTQNIGSTGPAPAIRGAATTTATESVNLRDPMADRRRPNAQDHPRPKAVDPVVRPWAPTRISVISDDCMTRGVLKREPRIRRPVLQSLSGAPMSPALRLGAPWPAGSDPPVGNRGSSPRGLPPTHRAPVLSVARSHWRPGRSRPPGHGTRPP
jgi:hypothetical protein